MYFPIFELHGWGKRFADQPQSIRSEIPKGRKTGRSKRNAPRIYFCTAFRCFCSQSLPSTNRATMKLAT